MSQPDADLSYHLGELEIARTPSHPGFALPTLPPGCRAVLDVGCGAGQSLIALNLPSSCRGYGVDIDGPALKLGRELQPTLWFAQSTGEYLPFASESMGLVFSRVALPYMPIRSSLAEFYRVLEPGGELWLLLHPFQMCAQHLWAGMRRLRWRETVYGLYTLTNGLCFHSIGREFRFPLNRRRIESFQTARGMKRACENAGFTNVRTSSGARFILTAQRPRSQTALKSLK